MKNPIAIAIADLHLRNDVPECVEATKEEWIAIQRNKLTEVVSVANSKDVPVLVAGDVFDHWKADSTLLPWVMAEMKKLKTKWLVVNGQHDLPYHAISRLSDSGLAVLMEGIPNFVYLDSRLGVDGWSGKGYNASEPSAFNGMGIILHRMVWMTKPFPGALPSGNAKSVLREYNEKFRFVICGDNHQAFAYSDPASSFLINCGPMTRQSVSDEPEPSYWILYPHTFKRIRYSTKEIISDAHLAKKKERDERLSAFVEQLEKTKEVGLSFVKNMKEFLAANKRIETEVKSLIQEWMEEEE